MNNPIATVVIPVFNNSDTLDRTVLSVCGQTRSDIEILLINDGSEEKTREKCNDWEKKDKRIRCIHKDNEGLGLTRNRGIDEAIGKYIFFVDSDDYIDENMVGDMIDAAETNSADIVTSDFYFDDAPETCILDEKEYSQDIKSYILPRLFGRIRSSVDDFFNVSACTKMYNVEFLRKNNLYCHSERELIWEDLAFNFDCLFLAEKIYVIRKPYYHYCYNGNSLTHVYDEKKIDRIISMYVYLMDLIEKRGLSEEAKNRLCFLVMGNIRMCIKQVALYCKLPTAMKEVRRIIGKTKTQEIATELKDINLSGAQRLFNKAIKNKNAMMVYSMALLQNIKSHGVID